MYSLLQRSEEFGDLNLQQRLRIAIANRLVGHHLYFLTYYHSFDRKDNPNLADRLMYSGKFTPQKVLEAYATKKKWMFGKTPILNFISILQVALNETNQNLTNVAAGSTAVSATGQLVAALGALALAASSAYGLVWGSNNTAVTRTDTKLNTQIAHGVTAATLQHGATSVSAVSNPSGTVTRTSVQRTATGNAASTVNIQEDGVYVGNSANKYCIERNISAFGAVGAAQVVTTTKNFDTTS